MLYQYKLGGTAMQIEMLRNLKTKLLGIKPKPVFLTVKQIREIMINNEDMPTAIFSAEKIDYIVKPRTIYAKPIPKSRIKY